VLALGRAAGATITFQPFFAKVRCVASRPTQM
jgi:hypothetical protein